jgi:hypothetical protein
MGDSTSVPADTARRLLESIAYCADLNRRFPIEGIPVDAPLRTRWQAGVRQAEKLCARANLLLHQARRMPPPVTNIAYRDTFAALPSFFRAYDAAFFAHEIPCSFDYPLCDPVPCTLFGAEYMLAFLRRLLAESVFLRAFSEDALRALYRRYYVDYEDLLVNLCLPAAEMALLCALAGEPVRTLALDARGYAAAGRIIARADAEAARAELSAAADRVLHELNFGGAMQRAYLDRTAQDLLTRLRATSLRGTNDSR